MPPTPGPATADDPARRQRVRRSVWLLVGLVVVVYAGFIFWSVMKAQR